MKNQKWNGREEAPSKSFNLLARIAGASVAMLFVATGAQAQHNDALVFQDGGQVQMGEIDVDCFSGGGLPGCDPNGSPASVFEAELVEVGITGTADEPGFFSVPDGGEGNLPFGDNLPGSANHWIDIILAPNSPVPGASILFWDGTGGSVTWSGVSNSEYFDIEGNGGSGGILTGTGTLSGINLDPTDVNGGFDTHPEFTLHGNGGLVDPTVGFYALFGITNVQGLNPSDPWAVVFDFGVENETFHEMAVDSIAGIVPEPGTGLLLAMGLVGMGMRRKQR